MKIFLDTSSLIKLYFWEEGTSELDGFFINNAITEIYISEITKTEFFSAIYKKLRIGVISYQNANDILNSFLADQHNYSPVHVTSEIINSSQDLIEKYGERGLRSLDAIQFASALSIKDLIEVAISADKLLNSFLIGEGIKIIE